MNKTVLIIDDDLVLRDSLALQLEMSGFDVVLAADGEEALERIQAKKPDVVITDVQMSHLNGFQLCNKLKLSPEYCDIPVMMLTSRPQEEDCYFSDYIRPDLYLTKPADFTELLQGIRDLLHIQHA